MKVQTSIDPEALIRDLKTRGIAESEAAEVVRRLLNDSCPEIDHATYDTFPMCEFSSLENDSNCETLMSTFENR